MNICSAIIRSR